MVSNFRGNSSLCFAEHLFVLNNKLLCPFELSNFLLSNPLLAVNQFNIRNSSNGFKNCFFSFLGFQLFDLQNGADLLCSVGHHSDLFFDLNDCCLVSDYDSCLLIDLIEDSGLFRVEPLLFLNTGGSCLFGYNDVPSFGQSFHFIFYACDGFSDFLDLFLAIDGLCCDTL